MQTIVKYTCIEHAYTSDSVIGLQHGEQGVYITLGLLKCVYSKQANNREYRKF